MTEADQMLLALAVAIANGDALNARNTAEALANAFRRGDTSPRAFEAFWAVAKLGSGLEAPKTWRSYSE